MKTIFVKPADFQRKWFIVDAEGEVLGRLAVKVAMILRGKHKPYYTPHQECGDYVIVINAEKAVLTGNKVKDKLYYNYSGYLRDSFESQACCSLGAGHQENAS